MRKRLHDYRVDIKERKDELIRVIEDAEELISEMNRFSDFAVTRIEEKNNVLLDTVAEADLKIQRLDALIMEETVINEPEAALAAAYVAYDEASITKILEEGSS